MTDTPPIKYARTSDGVNIAYFTIGQGPPLVLVHAIPYAHLEMEWADPGYRSFDERLARGSTLVRYDNRGSGLSDREIENYDLESLILDIEAVVDRLGFEKFALLGVSQGATAAIAFAVKHPERVTHLVMWCPFDAETPVDDELIHALRATGNYELTVQTIAHELVAGWEHSEHARRYARLHLEGVDREPLMEGRRSARFPVVHLLPSVTCPALVIHRRDAKMPPLQSGKRIAAGIPNAELVVIEGGALMPWIGDMEAITLTIDRFLGIPEQASPTAMAQPSAPAGSLATILFTDVEGSTALTDRMGDSAAREVLREHERITREQLRAYGGSEVKTMGDGFMASFGSATRALECAAAIQRAFDDTDIRVRCGLNAGEPIAEDDPDGRSDLFGTAVIVASRIAAQAEGREILVSDVVRQLVAGKGFLFNDRGEHALKGFEDPVRVFEVSWRE
jgi:class 3 adenylate cyclase/pimeloyl-ACP methyl ester carboxylesterase